MFIFILILIGITLITTGIIFSIFNHKYSKKQF